MPDGMAAVVAPLFCVDEFPAAANESQGAIVASNDPLHPVAWPVEVRGGAASVTYPRPPVGWDGNAFMAIPGFEPVAVHVRADPAGWRCDRNVELEAATTFVSGTVLAPGPVPAGVRVVGCGGVATVSANGSYVLSALPGALAVDRFGVCRLWADIDGVRPGLHEDVVPVEGETVRRDVSLTPRAIREHLLVDVAVDDAGLRVTRAHTSSFHGPILPSGGPSPRLLFRSGDVLLRVDGESLSRASSADPVGRLAEIVATPNVPHEVGVVRLEGGAVEVVKVLHHAGGGAPP